MGLYQHRHFDTAHLMSDLTARSVHGGAVALISQVIKFTLQMGSTVVLARLLLPSDFGLIAMVTAITNFVVMFKDAGLSMATVQRKDITHEQISTLFWINVALSAVVMIVVAAIAPLISAFYGQPRLVWVTLALAFTMLIGGFTVQHQALLRRQMRFKALAAVELTSVAGGIAAATTMALLGLGYWSLVGMVSTAAFVNAIMVWILCDWRPGCPKRRSGVGEMLRFGVNLTGANFANYVSQNLDKVLIGKFSTADLLGAYTKSYQLIMLPLQQLNPPVSQVAIPLLSRLQADGPRYRRAFLRIHKSLVLLVVPTLGVLVSCADWIILLILGDRWSEAIPFFVILGGIAIVQAALTPVSWFWTTQNRTDEQLRWALFDSVTTAVAISIGITWGALGVAVAFSLSGLLKAPIYVYAATRKGPVRSVDVWKNAAPPFALALLIAGLILISRALGFLQGTMTGLAFAMGVYCVVILSYSYLSKSVRLELVELSRWIIRPINPT